MGLNDDGLDGLHVFSIGKINSKLEVLNNNVIACSAVVRNRIKSAVAMPAMIPAQAAIR